MAAPFDLLAWLRDRCSAYSFDGAGVFHRQGHAHAWPLIARDPIALEKKLADGGHLLPLPKEPAALANVIEVSLVDHLLAGVDATSNLMATRGSERGYPDLEIYGPGVDGEYWAIDIKVARRAIPKKGPPTRTDSRITLYTGNTYFLHPELPWPGTLRPFGDYGGHVDVVVLYTLVPDSHHRAQDLEVLVYEPWQIASTKRSSGTREYIGAIDELLRLRAGKGDFRSREEFYRYWRSPQRGWKVSSGIQLAQARILKAKDAQLAVQGAELDRLRHQDHRHKQ